jgi:hypothetical protein
MRQYPINLLPPDRIIAYSLPLFLIIVTVVYSYNILDNIKID